MDSLFKGVTLGVLGIGCLPIASAQQSAGNTASAQYQASLNKYCVTCHSDKLKTAGLSLEKLDLRNPPASAEVWEKVIRKVRGNAMPPPGVPRPDKSFYESFPGYLEESLDHAAAARLNPGRPGMHRLNRAEYANAIRDLLGVQIDPVALLPTDDSGYGFDNIGDELSVSPTLLDRYLSAARKISRLAIGDPALRASNDIYKLPLGLRQEDRMSEDLPFGSRGGNALQHYFPVDGEYLIKVRLKREGDLVNGDGGMIRGVALKRQLDVSLDMATIKSFPVGGEHLGKEREGEGGGAGGGGVLVTYGVGDLFAGDPQQEEYERHGADANLEVRFSAKAGTHLVGVAFRMDDDSKPEGVVRSKASFNRGGGKNSEPWVESIAVMGPYSIKGLGETPSRQKIFVCHPATERLPAEGQPQTKPTAEEEGCAAKIFSALARKAYRRPVTSEDVQALLQLYKEARKNGGFEDGVEMAVQGMLVSPNFLFRLERDPKNVAPGTPYRVSDIELASRLSFFLWSSIPDAPLLDLAERGKLRNTEVLSQQVRRMLSDPRSKALVDNFGGQWLQLRHVAEITPDEGQFPEFDENLRQLFEKETEMFLESQIREDRPLTQLLDADYTFVNERLARHYGIPNVYGTRLRRVTLTDDNRRGLLGQGSILSLTSYPVRTSVVLRGVWLLTNILGTPPPAPPPNVPSLKDRDDSGNIKSVRESMEAHRANPVCASCHLRMDPLGFALENFDAIGKWRTTEGAAATPVDSSGKLPDGTTFNGPSELRKVLLRNPDLFATAVTEKLLTYALGRGVEYFDEPAVRKIRRDAAPDYRWSSLITAIVNSAPFQMRRTREQ